MAPKKPVKKTVVKNTAAKKPPMGPAKVGTTAEYRALAAENAAKKNLTQTASSILTKNATNASNALKAKDAARAVTTASKVGKVAGTLGKVAKFATKKSVAGTVALTAASSLVDYLNKNSKSGKMPGGNQNTTSGRGGRPQGFVPSKTTSNMGKNPIQKGTFKGPLPSTPSGSGSKYRVSNGDTLSGIASRAGVSLTELRAANPQIKDPRKIFRNTGITIPKGGKMPSGGYTGPVPYKAPKTK